MGLADRVHVWLVLHPISQNCLIALLFGIIFLLWGRYWNEIAALARLPPQKFGSWRLSAKIEVLRVKIETLRRCREDRGYATGRLASSFVFMLAYMGWMLVGVETFEFVIIDRITFQTLTRTTHPHERAFLRIALIVLVTLPLARLWVHLNRILLISDVLTRGGQAIDRHVGKLHALELKATGRVERREQRG